MTARCGGSGQESPNVWLPKIASHMNILTFEENGAVPWPLNVHVEIAARCRRPASDMLCMHDHNMVLWNVREVNVLCLDAILFNCRVYLWGLSLVAVKVAGGHGQGFERDYVDYACRTDDRLCEICSPSRRALACCS